MNYKIIKIHTKETSVQGLGALSFFEGTHDIPFEIKRIYYIYKVNTGRHRGDHAHKMLRQLIFCPYGVVKITLDDGKNREEIILDSPSEGVYLEPGLWREMDWLKDDSVLMVAASDYYDEKDYIRDYSEFLQYVGQRS